MGLLTGTASAPQGYWQGNEFIFPRFDNRKKPPFPVPALADLLADVNGSTSPGQPIGSGLLTLPMPTGDGGAGNSDGRDGRESEAASSNPGQSAVSDATANAAPAATGIAAPAGVVPGLPETPAAPVATEAPMAPTNQDLAVVDVDPQGPSGAGKAAPGSATSKSAAANAAGLAARSAVNQAIAEDQANAAMGKPSTNFTDAVADVAKGTTENETGLATGVNMNDVDETGGKTDNIGKSIDKEMTDIGAVTKGIASQVDAIAGMLGGIFGGLGTTSGAESNGNTGGGIGATGNPGPGNDTAGTAAADAGGSWRTGGPSGGDGDGRLEPIPATLHEGEFVQKPEAVSYYGDDFMHAINERRIPKRAAMGLLAKARAEEGPKTIRRGLLGI